MSGRAVWAESLGDLLGWLWALLEDWNARFLQAWLAGRPGRAVWAEGLGDLLRWLWALTEDSILSHAPGWLAGWLAWLAGMLAGMLYVSGLKAPAVGPTV